MIDWLTHWVAIHYDRSAFTWRELPGYLGALLIVASFLVRTMIPLRALSAAGNLCIVVYAWLDGLYPALALNLALFPLNLLRTVQMMKLVRRVRHAARGDQTMDWLKPYMARRPLRPRSVPVPQGRRRRRDVLYCFRAPSHPRTGN